MGVITLTTDFGTQDGYVGAVKGVISRIAPRATLVDIAHDLPRGDIAHAAWVVATSTLEFPHDTIHVVVVDPGVGGARQGVIARVPAAPPRGKQLYVGPDNGVFAYLPVDRAWRIAEDPERRVSPTFHGRDIFAPAAAALAAGGEPYGAVTQLVGALPWGPRTPGSGRIVHVDRFGNLITDLPEREVQGGVRLVDPKLRGTIEQAAVPGELRARMLEQAVPVTPVRRTFEDVAPGEPVVYVGSAGTIEIAIRDGRAYDTLGFARGDEVVFAVSPTPQAAQGPYR